MQVFMQSMLQGRSLDARIDVIHITYDLIKNVYSFATVTSLPLQNRRYLSATANNKNSQNLLILLIGYGIISSL